MYLFFLEYMTRKYIVWEIMGTDKGHFYEGT